MSDETLQGHVETDIAPPATSEAPQQEALEDVIVGDATYKVPAAVAESLRAARNPSPAPAASPAPAPKPAEEPEDLSVLWYTDPSKAARIIEERTYARVAQAYAQEKAAERFWRNYEEKHPDIKAARPIAEKILATEPKYRNMDDETGLKMLADDTRAMLRAAAPDREPTKPVVLEGGTQAPAIKSPAPTEPQGPQTISDWIRADREKRRSASAKFRQG